jgi:hypothetical protein
MPEPALPEETASRLMVLTCSLPELQRLFRDRGARRDGALLVFFILAWAMVLGPKFVGTVSAEKPAQQSLKSIMFRRLG